MRYTRLCSVLLTLVFAHLLLMDLPRAYAEEESLPSGQLSVEGTRGTVTQQIEQSPSVSSPKDLETKQPEIWKSFQLTQKPPFSGRIAFSADVNGVRKILLLDLTSKKVTSLIDGPGNNYFPSWSPDGESLAFVSDRDGNREIYISDWRGNNQKRITHHDLPDDNPSWHPDGKRVVFYRDADHENSDIYTVDTTQPSTAHRVTEFGGRNTTPRFHPDGERVIYSTNRFWPGWDVCEWNVFTEIEFCYLTGIDSYCRASWSPKETYSLIPLASEPISLSAYWTWVQENNRLLPTSNFGSTMSVL